MEGVGTGVPSCAHGFLPALTALGVLLQGAGAWMTPSAHTPGRVGGPVLSACASVPSLVTQCFLSGSEGHAR